MKQSTKANLSQTRYIALMGVLAALAAALSITESLICAAFPFGIRLGLANIIVMYALLTLDGRSALLLVLLKAGFVFASRGVTAAVLSLSGGLVSLAVMLLLLRLKNPSLMTISVSGGVLHNLAQLAAAYIIYGMNGMLFYVPVLLISGAAAGIGTAALLAAVFAVLGRERLDLKISKLRRKR